MDNIKIASDHPYIAAYGLEEARWLLATIEAWWEVNDPEGDYYEFTDNFRIARSDRPEELRAYEDAMYDGCCGSVDATFGPSPGGFGYLWGFNHGH